jgi:hypothetical protein
MHGEHVHDVAFEGSWHEPEQFLDRMCAMIHHGHSDHGTACFAQRAGSCTHQVRGNWSVPGNLGINIDSII